MSAYTTLITKAALSPQRRLSRRLTLPTRLLHVLPFSNKAPLPISPSVRWKCVNRKVSEDARDVA